MAEHSERNPFRSLALPIGVRALLAGACAMWLLFRNAQALFAAPETVLGALVAALVLLARATLDAVLFFKTWVPLPARAVVPMALDVFYKPDDLTTLVVSAISPNQQRYLGRLGQWLSRASTRFSSLPLQYQWLVENGLIILATVFPMAAAVFLVTALAAAGGRPDVAAAVRPWLFAVLLLFVYGQWAIIVPRIFRAPQARTPFKSGVFLRWLVVMLVAEIVVAFVVRSTGLPYPPDLAPLGVIGWLGTCLVLAAVFLVVSLRSAALAEQLQCSRIQEGVSAPIHPQGLVTALRSCLQQSKAGRYQEIGSWDVHLNEQRGMQGGSFESNVVGEYGGTVQPTVLPAGLLSAARAIAYVGIGLSAIAYLVLVTAPASSAWARHWASFLALELFSALFFLIGTLPLSEWCWSSWLMVFRLRGNYQGRNTLMMAANAQNASVGSFMTDFNLDGGIASVASSAFMNPLQSRVYSTRVLVGAAADDVEKSAILQRIGAVMSGTVASSTSNPLLPQGSASAAFG
jgi:hypothetical protein